MSEDTSQLQNEYFGNLRKDRAVVTVLLLGGKTLTGTVKAFDKFTVLLAGPEGEQIIFKHAIASVGLVARGDSGREMTSDTGHADAATRRRS